MAIYHLHASIGKRQTGQSAGAKFDYLERRGRYRFHSYEKADYAESGNMPGWAKASPHRYWSAADTFERANAKLFYHIEFALPIELTIEENIHLASAFCCFLSSKPVDVTGNLPFSMALHPGKGHNPHCHVMLSERANDGVERSRSLWFKRANRKAPDKGGALKTRTMQPKKWLIKVRKEWSGYANNALSAAGYLARIDHRSYSKQGVDRLPGLHIGSDVLKMEEKGISTDRFNTAIEAELLNRKIAGLIEEKKHIEDAINRFRESK